MRLYIIRHGDPDYPKGTITEQGHLEANALAERLGQEGLTHIYSSPMGRAVHTAEYTVRKTGLEPTVLEWTKELNSGSLGDNGWGKGALWDIAGELVRPHAPYPSTADWHERRYFDHPGCRSMFAELEMESDRLLASHGYERQDGMYRITRGNKDRIAVFCHMGFGLAWLAYLLALPLPMVWSGFWLAPSSVTTILFDERSAQLAVPRALAVGDTSHLHIAGLPVQPRGIIANFD